MSSNWNGLNIMTCITIEIEILGNDVEVEIDYEWHGKNIAQTYYQPAEYAELEINSIKRIIEGSNINISSMFTDSEYEEITDILQKWLNDGDEY